MYCTDILSVEVIYLKLFCNLVYFVLRFFKIILNLYKKNSNYLSMRTIMLNIKIYWFQCSLRTASTWMFIVKIVINQRVTYDLYFPFRCNRYSRTSHISKAWFSHIYYQNNEFKTIILWLFSYLNKLYYATFFL